MISRRLMFLPLALGALALVMAGAVGTAWAEKPTVAAPCVQCHKAAPDVIRGSLVSVSERFGTIQLAAGKLVWVVKYDANTKLMGAAALKELPKEKEIAVSFTGTEKEPYAVSVSVKPPAKLPADKLVSTGEMANLVAMGAEKGAYTLLDSRPMPRYVEGHIPTALAMPLAEFDKLKEKLLPVDKKKLVIFYCGGVTWRLSPASARKAEDAGYTNVKVYHEGLPEWKKSKGLVVSEPEYLMDLMKKDISRVLVDVRDAKEAGAGHIKGAVSVPLAELQAAKEMFPGDKTAPVIIYGADEAFKTVREWGYKNASVLRGGLNAYKEKGGEVSTGPLEKKIVYVFKARPGEILIEEFKQIAESKPEDKVILDVREEDEAMRGMLVGAVNIPGEKLRDRLAELPKDKEIIVHCVTGMRAEAAFGILKENGFKTRFLNAVIQIDPDGKYEIVEK